MNDIQLLREYTENGSEKAFKALLEKHVDLVYRACIRQVHDPGLAEDATQAVFIILSKKARTFSGKPLMSGWLIRTAQFVCMNEMKKERRRKVYEMEAQQMADAASTECEGKNRILGFLDEALFRLREKDRNAVILRYLENRSIKDVGTLLGITEDAAEKRITRAMARLRNICTRRGVTASGAVLAGVLLAEAAQAAPAGLARTCMTVTLNAGQGGGAAQSMSMAKETTRAMMWAKIKSVATAGLCSAVIIAGGAVGRLHNRGGEPSPEKGKIEGNVINVPGDMSTIQEAVDVAKDGDTVLIAPGLYEESVAIEGKSVVIASHFLTTDNKSYISKTVLQGKKGSTINVKETAGPDTKIIGLTINSGSDGINCRARIHILHNIIKKNTDGIEYAGNGISGGICRYNIFEDCGDDGIDIDSACDVIIEKNIIRNNGDNGIKLRFYGYTGKDMLAVIIRENIITGSGKDGIQLIHHDGPIKRVARIERNMISDTRMSAIGCMWEGKTREDYKAAEIPDCVYIINNTFIDNNYGVTGGGNLVVLNNIFAGTKNIAVKGTGEPAVVAYNIFWKNGTDHEQSNVIKEHTLYKDPGLDTNGKLVKTSPCIDAGVSEFYWRNEKVLEMAETSFSGNKPDLGAVEFSQ